MSHMIAIRDGLRALGWRLDIAARIIDGEWIYHRETCGKLIRIRPGVGRGIEIATWHEDVTGRRTDYKQWTEKSIRQVARRQPLK